MQLFLIVVVAAVSAGAGGEAVVQEKRGALTYSTAAPEEYKVPQVVQKAVVAPQPHYYSQPTVKLAPAAYAAPQQYQYEPQAVAYAQPAVAKLAVPVKVAPQYSLAGDVSSFSYSSPVVQYNSLGLLTQLAGNVPQKLAYAAAPAQKAVYAPAPASVLYRQVLAAAAAPAPAPIAYKQVVAAAPAPQYQQATYVQPQVEYAPAPQYTQAPVQHVYAADPQPYAAPQAAAHTIQQPQYYAVPSSKYANPGITYAQ